MMTAEQPDAKVLDDQQTAIAMLVTEISTLVPMILNLTNTHQRGLGFATYLAKAAQDAALRAEAEDLAQLLKEMLERGVLPSEGYTTGAGESANPGNIAAISIEAELWAALTHLVRRLSKARTTAARGQGICHWPPVRIPAEPTIADLLIGLRALVWQTESMQLLTETERELNHLREAAKVLIEGNDRIKLQGLCPHCKEPTLVVYFRDDLIRCDRHPETGRFENCICSDPFCECKNRPIAFRHEWHQDKPRSKANSWEALRDHLDVTNPNQGATS